MGGYNRSLPTAMEQFGEPCKQIKMRIDEFSGGFSGGTAGCLIYGMEHPDDELIRECMTQPYSLNPEGMRQGAEKPNKMMSTEVEFDEDLGVWTKPFFMGPMNTKIVRRSHRVERATERVSTGKCAKCNYDLRGSEFSARCPECGTLVR